MEVYYKHPDKNKIKKVKRGYSWTTLLFGICVPLFRLDLKWFCLDLAVITLLSVIANFLSINVICLSIPAWVIWANYYNSFYEKDLIRKGYEVVNI